MGYMNGVMSNPNPAGMDRVSVMSGFRSGLECSSVVYIKGTPDCDDGFALCSVP